MTAIISSKISPIHSSVNIGGQIQNSHLNDSYISRHNGRLLSGPNLNDKRYMYMTISNDISRKLTDVSDNQIIDNEAHEILMKAKFLVNEAIKNKMIFSIYGPYERIRCVLRERGWVEKKIDDRTPIHFHQKSKSSEAVLFPNISGDIPKDKSESKINHDIEMPIEKSVQNNELQDIASQLVYNCTPDFIWSLKMVQIDMKNIKPNQIINHFRKSGSFTTKTGLIKSFNSLRWYEKDPDEVFPRSYIISDEDEKKAFLNDYYLTACMSMLRLTADVKELMSDNIDMETYDICEISAKDTNNSKYLTKKVIPCINYNAKEVGYSQHLIDRKYPEMAISYCQLYFKSLKNKDLDTKELVFCSNKKWEEFFENFCRVTFEGYGIQCTENIRTKCKELCDEFKGNYRQYNLNGTKNIWIVKPGAKSRGRGISCISKFSELNNILRSNSDTLIIQKYIERPLLIYNTKFDIRQWFLVTSWSPLTIWWYNDSYIRFCSQQFTLNDFNESVHLSNNSIQHKYQNGPRSKYLPENNMWNWETFETYLNEHGYENGWKKEILPSMKHIIIDILLCSQEEIEDRKNSFELYGADFMITENDLKTWLIEINSSPCMAPSTEVTARLTKSVLEDIIKVVLDYPKNIYSDTGQFELLFKQTPFPNSIIDRSHDLTVIGNTIKKPVINYKSSQEFGNRDRRLVVDDTSILRNKLRLLVGNLGIHQTNSMSEELVRKHHFRTFYRQIQENIPKEHFNEKINSTYKRSISQDHNTTMHYNEFLKNHISNSSVNYTMNLSSTKGFHHKDEQSDRNLPIIRSSVISKIPDKYNYRVRKSITDKNINPGWLCENSILSKVNSLRSSDGNNKRIDQLIKAYMPNLARK